MGSKLSDLNDYLFAQMGRLSEKDLSAEALDQEVKRAAAIVGIADQVVHIADLQLKAAKLFSEHGAQILPMLPQIGKAADPA